VPLTGERITIGDWEFEVLDSSRTRIKKLCMRPASREVASTSEDQNK
jgi:CBS domain containing-hemolysin-like protein